MVAKNKTHFFVFYPANNYFFKTWYEQYWYFSLLHSRGFSAEIASKRDFLQDNIFPCQVTSYSIVRFSKPVRPLMAQTLAYSLTH